MKIYVIHDNAVVVQTLLEFLSELGYSPTPLRSASELLTGRENGRKADAVLVKRDVVDEGFVGTLHELHQRRPRSAFILVGSALGSLPAAQAISCGVYAYLREPIRLSELELVLARLGESRLARH
jgi:DNA-binding NtrC family response regulator